jgi:predicted nucleic acid-binding Zn ribbon protein
MSNTAAPDRLTIEASAALAAGTSYGKWKAAQQADPNSFPPVPSLSSLPVGPPYIAHCIVCGVEIVTQTRHQRKYCTQRCRETLRKPRNRKKESRCE